MSHSLYELTDEPGHMVYELLQDEIGLTAKSGLIAPFVGQTRGTEPGGWRVNERDLLSWSGGNPDTRAIVVL